MNVIDKVQRMTRYIESEGVVIDRTEQTATLAEYLSGDPIPRLFEQATAKGLKLVYHYDMQRQPPHRRGKDAETWKNVTLDGNGVWYAIGISNQAISAGQEYTVFLALHELTHVLTDCREEHTAVFHAYLDHLIDLYNQTNGTQIKNDYYSYAVQGETDTATAAESETEIPPIKMVVKNASHRFDKTLESGNITK